MVPSHYEPPRNRLHQLRILCGFHQRTDEDISIYCHDLTKPLYHRPIQCASLIRQGLRLPSHLNCLYNGLYSKDWCKITRIKQVTEGLLQHELILTISCFWELLFELQIVWNSG